MHGNAIRYFLEVARAGSFRGASERLHVAASAINRQIAILEKNIGVDLFERNRGRKKLRLTAAGEILATRASSANAEIERGLQEIEGLKRVPAGSVRLGIPETFIHEFLPGFLARFRSAHPQIWFEIAVAGSPRLLDLLQHGEIAIALAYNQKIPRSIKVVFELARQTCVMVRKDHPLAGRSFVELQECAHETFVMPDHGTSMRGLYDQVFSSFEAKPPVALVTTSYEMLRSAVRAGLGIAIVNEYLDIPHPDALSEVVFVPIRHPQVKPQWLFCCIPSRQKIPAATKIFAAELEAAVSALKRAP